MKKEHHKLFCAWAMGTGECDCGSPDHTHDEHCQPRVNVIPDPRGCTMDHGDSPCTLSQSSPDWESRMADLIDLETMDCGAKSNLGRICHANEIIALAREVIHDAEERGYQLGKDDGYNTATDLLELNKIGQRMNEAPAEERERIVDIVEKSLGAFGHTNTICPACLKETLLRLILKTTNEPKSMSDRNTTCPECGEMNSHTPDCPRR